MALFIQLHKYTPQEEKLMTQNYLSPEKISSILLNLKKSLELGGTQNIHFDNKSSSNSCELVFTAKIDRSSEILYRFWDCQGLKIKSCITLFQKNNYLRPRSTEIRKNICKTTAFINSISKKSQVYLLINPISNQIQFLNNFYLGCNQPKEKLFTDLKILISQCFFFAKSYISLILYKSNLINKYSLLSQCSQQMRSNLNSSSGEFSSLKGIRQQLSYCNISISSSLKQTRNCKIEKNFHENINKIIQIYNNRIYTHDLTLYTEINVFNKQRKAKKELENFSQGMVSYKPTPCTNYDNNLIFSTIYIQQQDKIKQNLKCIATTPKAQLYYFKGKIKYGYTHVANDKFTSSEQEVIPESATPLETYLFLSVSRSIQKGIIVKTVNNSLPAYIKKKVSELINYEKAVVRNLRGAECIYLPKYYQTVQKYSCFRGCLLIDYLPGMKLGDMIVNRAQSLTLSWKIHLLMHLANAIRFLQYYDIAHLDLSVNNIIMTNEGLPKIIDFGQAYHEETLKKQKNLRTIERSNGPAFLAGRTFPFAPPETSQRTWNFNSKQDMFSLGVIAYILVMGYFPNTCSQSKIEQLYKNKTYNESIYLSPQGLEWTGEIELMTSCMQLIMSCLHTNQKMRPNPSLAHLIFKKLHDLIQSTT